MLKIEMEAGWVKITDLNQRKVRRYLPQDLDVQIIGDSTLSLESTRHKDLVFKHKLESVDCPGATVAGKLAWLAESLKVSTGGGAGGGGGDASAANQLALNGKVQEISDKLTTGGGAFETASLRQIEASSTGSANSVAPNPLRRGLILQNPSATDVVWIAFGVAANVENGFRLEPMECRVFENNVFRGEVFAYCENLVMINTIEIYA